MALAIGDIVRSGYERSVARNGLQFLVVFYVLSLLNALFSTALIPESGPSGQFGGQMGVMTGDLGAQNAPTLGLSPGVALLLSVILGLVSLVVSIGAIRTFVSDETQRIPQEHFSRKLVWALVNVIVGGIVFGIILGIGFVLLVIPGLFLLVSLFFWEVYVVVEDQNFIDGFRSSWSLTRGHRFRLFGLGVVMFVIAIVISIVFSLPGLVLGNVIGFLIAQIGDAFISVFYVATFAVTYNRLTDQESSA